MINRERSTNRMRLKIAQTLVGALPYLQRYDKTVIVVKVGGHALNDAEALASFAKDVVLISQVGIFLVVVHGGGPNIDGMLKRLGIKSRFVRGKRVSDAQTVDVVEMVLAGHVNKRIVHAVNLEGGRAIGFSGKDAGLLRCKLAAPELGQVGIPVRVDGSVIQSLYKSGFVPVIAPTGIGPDGETLNVNGDTAAGAIASALGAERLMLLTDVDGVKNRADQLVPRLSFEQIEDMIESGEISGGMIPKTETAIDAVSNGVEAAVVLNSRTPHSLLLELFTEHGIGTMISRETAEND
ncbi:MAG: acetylglutamate kinase [Rhodobacteraceae bacterium]|nr:acetylglutamate kinase [Paracoccaceae bacterium]